MKYRKLFLAAALAFAAAAAFGFTAYSISSITAAAPALAAMDGPPTIVIDAGHGGFDGGATGVGGVVEKDVNLAVAKKLRDLFIINGFDAVLTRGADIALNDEGLATIRKKKNSDIHNRLSKAESYDNCILLSIHQNKFPQAKYFGAQVFYGPKNPGSADLGHIMQQRLVRMVQPENTRVEKACGDSVYLIHNAPMPALLIECGFLSNPEDAAKLVDEEYQRRLAFTIFAGTMEYLGAENTQIPPDGGGTESQTEGS